MPSEGSSSCHQTMPVPRFASVILILSFLLQIALCRREEEAIFDAGALSFWKPAHQSLAELREDNGVYKELTSGCGCVL